MDSAIDHALLETLPAGEPGCRRRWLPLFIISMLLGAVADPLIFAAARIRDSTPRAREVTAPGKAAFYGVGDRIIVPEASSLRALLSVIAPSMKDVVHQATSILGCSNAQSAISTKTCQEGTHRRLKTELRSGERMAGGLND